MRSSNEVRHDWTREEVEALFDKPLIELVFEAATVHRKHHIPTAVQMSTLLSIKTGGCPEDCKYCPQSAHYETSVDRDQLIDIEAVKSAALKARSEGSTRFCMGAAWRAPPSQKKFDQVIDMVKVVRDLGMETCATLGMLKPDQAVQLKEAGLDYYNHNLDTSPEYYGDIITTRTYQDRLDTLGHVRDAGMAVCCGGIIGMGEETSDRAGLLLTLATMSPHPESVPINTLVAVEGTPMAGSGKVDALDWVRMIAVARILMPDAYVRLSAGRTDISDEAHAMAFMAGANSIFAGEQLLTTPNPGDNHDARLLKRLGMVTEGAIPTSIPQESSLHSCQKSSA